MMKSIAFIFAVTICFVTHSDPTKSMLGEKMNSICESSSLPDGVIAVEYLESTGTQYIEVGPIIGATSIRIVVSASEIPESGAMKFYGICYNANFLDDFGVNATGWGGSSKFPCTVGKSIEFEAGEDGIFVDGTYLYVGIWFVRQRDEGKIVFLFSGSSGNKSYVDGNNYKRWKGRIESCVVYSGEMKMIDLIPVRIENTGYMYDLVSGELLGNDGKGEFIIGPDKEL